MKAFFLMTVDVHMSAARRHSYHVQIEDTAGHSYLLGGSWQALAMYAVIGLATSG